MLQLFCIKCSQFLDEHKSLIVTSLVVRAPVQATPLVKAEAVQESEHSPNFPIPSIQNLTLSPLNTPLVSGNIQITDLSPANSLFRHLE